MLHDECPARVAVLPACLSYLPRRISYLPPCCRQRLCTCGLVIICQITKSGSLFIYSSSVCMAQILC